MNVLHKAVACALLLSIYTAAAVVATSSKEIEGIPSNFNYIIHEEYNSNLSSDQIISVSTNVPLTIQRYSDNYFRSGEAPFDSGDAAVLITSNCDATTYIPEVEWSDENDSITVMMTSSSSDETSLNDMPFIDSSSYVVKWEYDPCSTAGGQSAEATERRLNEGHAFSIMSSIRTLLQRSISWGKEEKATKDRELQQLSTVESSTSACNINVEIMVDSCSHNIDVTSAPAVRVVDAMVTNTKHKYPNPNDECLIEHKTDILFDSQYAGRLGEGNSLVPMVVCLSRD